MKKELLDICSGEVNAIRLEFLEESELLVQKIK